MPSVQSLLSALDERTISQRVGLAHDEARLRYPLRRNTVADWREFETIIGEYYAYHFNACVSRGGILSRAEAASRAKEILERDYRRQQGDIVTAYNDAHEGTAGGLRTVLDKLSDAIRAECVERYIRDTFDRYVSPASWEDKLEIIKDFIQTCGVHLSSSIRADQPERYARDYSELIRAYAMALQRTSSIFRRM